MAITNHERVGKALEILKEGLGPFVDREIEDALKTGQITKLDIQNHTEDKMTADRSIIDWDVSALLKIMRDTWNKVLRKTLGSAERSLVIELLQHRNKWAHQQTFSSDDADRALDSMVRLLTAVSAPESDEINKMKMELRRQIFDQQMHNERRKSVGTAIESQSSGALKAWREVVIPHQDVASGRYQQAEFAADLWQVHLGEGSDEYRQPAEFFRRTYLTESLKQLLTGAVRRLFGRGGDPVVQLQTNFGGGKTHSMLALYHLFSGVSPREFVGIDAVLEDAEEVELPKDVKRVVLVGNKISPGNPVVKADGTKIHTLWGELAWQLGGKEAYKRIQADDEKATSPGDVLRELMNEYGPCLILIDEWVAYARQLHADDDLPGGSFETHFTFAQALTESAKLAKQCLLVISLPSSDTAGSPHAQADDVEVGGERGRAALDRLRNAVGRVEASWRPASAEEGFEIVRRRLFEPLMEKNQFVARDTVARAFYDLYRTQHQEFPSECRDSDYEKRMKAAYPIHPEVFDRLYTDWSTLVKFQRTRGVLRLMAAVIHSLWEKGDKNPLIMPANISIDDSRVQSELTRYLSDNWAPVIEKDVDGPNALPLRLDEEVPNLGKYMACRRVARTIYLGSAPILSSANRGLEDRRIKLGCVMPDESPSVFGDALRRLSGAATYLYQDASHYWYSTQPTVSKMAEDRAEHLKRDPDAVAQEVIKRMRADLQNKGDFSRIHPFPHSGADVPDDRDARLVVLGIDYPYSKEEGNPAEQAAKAIFENRGNTPRLYRNTLVFMAVDKNRLQDLDEAARRFLAWESILAEKEELDLSPHQVKQAETQKKAMEGAVIARLPEAYQWLLVPVQNTPQEAIKWQSDRLSGQDALAVRAGKKLLNDELLVIKLAATRLRMELDRVPLWRGNHVEIKQIVEDFVRYLYLPRLKNPEVLLDALRHGFDLLTWEQDSFAYAESYDEKTGRYRGLSVGKGVSIDHSFVGLLVRPDVAMKQNDAETKTVQPTPEEGMGRIIPGGSGETPPEDDPKTPTQTAKPRRYHGSVSIDPTRVGRDAGKIAEAVIAHLAGLVGSSVRVTLEIEADIPNGVAEDIVRIVTENGRTLKFSNQGFEME